MQNTYCKVTALRLDAMSRILRISMALFRSNSMVIGNDNMSVLLGYIADDFTGTTDVANELQQQGLKTVLFLDNLFSEIDLSGFITP